MKKIKQMLSWLLVICMVLGMVPTFALTAGAAATYTKVTSAPSDWSGTYLIVYEEGGLALNGALETLDAVGNSVAVTVDNGSITGSDAIDAATVTISAVTGGYSIKTAFGDYIGRTADSNGLNTSSSTEYVNTLSMNEDGTVNIVGSGGAYLRYNPNSGQTRFRYFKSTTYTNQKAVALYKLGGGTITPVTYTVSYYVSGELTGTATTTGSAVMETASFEGYEMAGWTTSDTTALQNGTTTAPSPLYAAGSTQTVSSDLDLYAVFLKNGTYTTRPKEDIVTETPSGKTYTKVETEPADWSGKYLIVYEAGSLAFNSALASVDVSGNSIPVVISGKTISGTATIDAAAVTIAKTADGTGYSILTGSGKYIGRTATSAGMNTNSTQAYSHTLTVNTTDNSVDILSSGGPYLRYNESGTRFRYYASAQKPVALYKLEGSDENDTPSSDAYQLVTGVDQLVIGGTYVIAAAEFDYAMGIADGDKAENRAQIAITKDGDLLYITDEVQTLTLGNGAIDGTYSFYDADHGGYLYASSIDKNYMLTQPDVTVDSSFAVSIAENGVMTASAQGETERNTFRYNRTYSLFSCYRIDSSSTDLEDVALYRKVEAVTGDSEATMKIITGEGTAYFSLDGGATQYGTAATARGEVVRNAVDGGIALTLVVKPKSGYRVACIEKSSDRLVLGTDYSYDASIGGYLFTFTTEALANKGQNYFRISFSPRVGDAGYSATQITGWDNTVTEGLFVITGMASPEDYLNNNHSTTTTYLLYGDDDTAKDDNAQAVGRKSSALLLSNIGVTLNNQAPYMMTGLNERHIMQFEKYDGEYYTISFYGATEQKYYINLIKETEAPIKMVTEVTDSALWSISYLENGAVQIQNKAFPTRYLAFNSSKSNLQFRCYTESNFSGGTADYPVLYGVSKDNYQVTYSVNGSGTVTAINTTTNSAVASGTYQPKDSTVTFTFTPANGWLIGSVTVNDAAVVLSGNTYTYTGLDRDLNVKVTYTLPSAVSFKVEYYLNNDLMVTKNLTERSPYVIDATVEISYKDVVYPVSAFSFDQAVNGTAIYTDLNAAVKVEAGDTIKAYFSTTKVDNSKTITETTAAGASSPVNGGVSGSVATGDFTAANGKDENGNIKQTYDVTLKASSNAKIDAQEEGGNTDIIVILDNSNSMYPDYSDNVTYLKKALTSFADITLTADSGNRVAVVTYNSLASAFSGIKGNTAYYLHYSGSMDPADYVGANSSITYDNCFIDNKTDFTKVVNAMLVQDAANGATNTMGGWKMAEIVAKTRPTDTKRNLVVLMFTDGKPTVRYSQDTGSSTVASDGTDGGLYTSANELNMAINAALSLRTTLQSYNCDSKIYNVALLNNNDYANVDYKLVEYLMSNKTITGWSWEYDSNVTEVTNYMDNSSYWVTVSSYADAYIPIIGDNGAEEQLNNIFTTIAYTTTPEKRVTGTITDVIPVEFVLSAESEAALIADGWTVTHNANGTTTISGRVVATEDGTALNYSVEYQGSGYGGIYTNESASFTYLNLETSEDMVAYFPMPVASVVPWTVDDQANTQLSTVTTIDVLSNDLFTELTDGGYTLSNFTVTLTDANGNPMVYNDAVEQVGCGFDATVDLGSNTVAFYTEEGGSKTFYYVVSATATAPDGTSSTVYSRATKVDVVVPNVDLGKTAQDMSTDSEQLFLVTLTASTVNSADVVTNGTITDIIPSNFEFVEFVTEPATGTCTYENNVIRCTGISLNESNPSETLSYYIRYIGEGYGVLPTNASASLAYNFSGSTGTTTQYFPVPYAAIDPVTVNDVDIALAGETYTLNVQSNDHLQAHATGGYTLSPATTVLTDANGKPLTAAQIAALGIDPVVNADGSLTYTAPDAEGVTQFYYAVTATATAPDGTTTTIGSRPTLVTIYTAKNTFIVIDFGLKTQNILFSDYSGVYVDDGKLLSDLVTTGSFIGNSTYGTISAANGLVSFRPTTIEFTGLANYDCTFTMKPSEYNANTAKSVTASFTVIPANNVYFEENFVEFDAAWGDEGTRNQNATQAAGEEHNTAVHGYDATYAVQETYSNGSMKSVTVSADVRNQAAWFTYTGTGFDIISSTNPNSGIMVAQIYKYDPNAENGCGELVKNILVDTWLENYTYDQIPVIMYRGDYGTYRVRVRAFYNEIFDHNYAAADFSEAKVREVLGLPKDAVLEISSISLEGATPATRTVAPAANGQYNVYLDAIRIYNPLGSMADETMGTAAAIYAAAGEMNPVFTNVNDALLGVDNWTQGTQAGGILYVAADNSNSGSGDTVYSGVHLGTEGQLYTVVGEDGKTYLANEQGDYVLYAGQYPVYTRDGKYFYVKNGKELELTAEQAGALGIAFYNDTYELIGPENEVYLKNGQGIAFAVDIDTSAQLSLKIPYGTTAKLQMHNGSGWVDVATVISATEMYYAIDTDLIANGLAILRCVSSDANTILSVCNLKLASSNAVTTGELRTMSMEQIVTAVNAFSAEHEHTWGEWTVITEPTCTVKGEESRTCAACGEVETREIAPIECPSCEMTDVPAEVWYHDAVDFMLRCGYMQGVAADRFAPDGTLNRAMVVTVLYRVAGEPEVAEKSGFMDVPENEWYSDAIAWAQAEGVVNGVTDTEFAPLTPVTREQIATILYRYVGTAAGETDMSGFADADKISPWALEAMSWAVEEGIFLGDDRDCLNPTANATRAQFAAIIMRFLTK